MLKVLKKRERIILYFTLGVIIFSVVFNFLIYPGLTENNNLNNEIIVARLKLLKYMGVLSQKEEIQQVYAQLSPSQGISEENQDTFVALLAELESLARAANIRIIDIRPQALAKTSSVKEILVDLRSEGNAEGYLKFIYGLENSLFLLRVKKIQITAKPNSQVLEGTLTILQSAGI